MRSAPRPFRLILARLLTGLGLSRFFRIHGDGYDLRFYPTNVSANLWIDPGSRVHDVAIFRDYCKDGDVAVDVGANIGEMSIMLSQRVGSAGRVFAFEPHPRIFRYLNGNLALNRCTNVVTRNLALGPQAGRIRFSDGKRDDMNREVSDGPIEIACSTLDAEMAGVGPIAFLKVDVEGNELPVLRGASATILRIRCINCEMGEAHFRRYGYGMGELISFLQLEGFRTFIISGSRQLTPVEPSFRGEAGYELVAVRDLNEFLARTAWAVA